MLHQHLQRCSARQGIMRASSITSRVEQQVDIMIWAPPQRGWVQSAQLCTHSLFTGNHVGGLTTFNTSLPQQFGDRCQRKRCLMAQVRLYLPADARRAPHTRPLHVRLLLPLPAAMLPAESPLKHARPPHLHLLCPLAGMSICCRWSWRLQLSHTTPACIGHISGP